MLDLSITGVSHLELYVSDVAASRDWYESAVGLEVLRTAAGDRVIMKSPNSEFRLILCPDRAGDAHGEFGHVAFAVQSMDVLESWAKHLDDVGMPYKGIKENPNGHTIDLIDPDGYDVELSYEISAGRDPA
jgi:catechol-2,3-dioxygenase